MDGYGGPEGSHEQYDIMSGIEQSMHRWSYDDDLGFR
jgi:hypothetical protein